MCGIAGCYDLSRRTSEDQLADAAAAMGGALRHRGPDDQGAWIDGPAGVALAHRRLAILDLSPAGHQPMRSSCGRYVLVYNGEIYNFRELRAELVGRGRAFRGHSDTEVLLTAVAEWGVEAAVRRLDGMFAFALWDARQNALTLVRDPLGIKPLYYGWFGAQFLFASELKALRRHPAFRGEIDRHALALFLESGYIPAPCCIYRGVRKLLPGSLMTVSPKDTPQTTAPSVYWSIAGAVAVGKSRPFAGTAEEAVDALGERLAAAVRRQLVADVPVGVFLSGGIDSSLVTALAAAGVEHPTQAFTIGFEEPQYDESRDAREIASYLNVEHHVEIVTSRQALEAIPRLPAIYDEPFADSSQIPTFLVSQMARRQVTVCLSGDGGDELFGGYPRYDQAARLRRQLGWLPRPALRGITQAYDRLLRPVRQRAEPGMAARLGAARNDLELYLEVNRHWSPAGAIVVEGSSSCADFRPADHWPELGRSPSAFIESMMAYDAAVYLPDDLLTKVDRASMAASLEVRVPVLDVRVVELAWSLPLEFKRAGGLGKQPLRALLRRFLPAELFERPKRGFAVPIGRWLRGPLKDWAEELLDLRRLARDGLLRPQPIRRAWEEHVAGTRDWQYRLWDVLMFQAWLQESA